MDKLKFMREALIEAKKAYLKEEVPIGCIIVKDNIIIGRGHNMTEEKDDPRAHGEMIAIGEAIEHMESWRLLDCDLYVTIEPCPMCMGAILNGRIENLYIGAMNPRYGACGSIVDLNSLGAFNHKLNIEKGILEKECATIMKSFFKKRRDK